MECHGSFFVSRRGHYGGTDNDFLQKNGTNTRKWRVSQKIFLFFYGKREKEFDKMAFLWYNTMVLWKKHCHIFGCAQKQRIFSDATLFY